MKLTSSSGKIEVQKPLKKQKLTTKEEEVYEEAFLHLLLPILFFPTLPTSSLYIFQTFLLDIKPILLALSRPLHKNTSLELLPLLPCPFFVVVEVSTFSIYAHIVMCVYLLFLIMLSVDLVVHDISIKS
jgi:hypothetical protein